MNEPQPKMKKKVKLEPMKDLIKEIEVREEMMKLPTMCSCFSYK